MNWQVRSLAVLELQNPQRGKYPAPCTTQEAWACCSSPYGLREFSILRMLGATVMDGKKPPRRGLTGLGRA